jgi:hypothetical protein
MDFTTDHSMLPGNSKVPGDSKVPGIYYMEYLINENVKDDNVDPKERKKKGDVEMTPQVPPTTTWSGILACPSDSPYADRLKKKCSGVIFEKNGMEWIAGFWTAPANWPEMAAGRESPRPFSSKTHSAKDFPYLSLKA